MELRVYGFTAGVPINTAATQLARFQHDPAFRTVFATNLPDTCARARVSHLLWCKARLLSLLVDTLERRKLARLYAITHSGMGNYDLG
jgi:hypothetical protein